MVLVVDKLMAMAMVMAIMIVLMVWQGDSKEVALVKEYADSHHMRCFVLRYNNHMMPSSTVTITSDMMDPMGSSQLIDCTQCQNWTECGGIIYGSNQCMAPQNTDP